MDCGLQHIYKFLKFRENHKIKIVGMLSDMIHLWQLLDVYVFQIIKYWHSKATNEAVQSGDRIFFKAEFLIFSNSFWRKVFKESKVCFAKKKTGLIFYNSAFMIDKFCEWLPLIRGITLPHPNLISFLEYHQM